MVKFNTSGYRSLKTPADTDCFGEIKQVEMIVFAAVMIVVGFH